MVYVFERYFSCSQESFGVMHQCYCSEVLKCEASLLSSISSWLNFDQWCSNILVFLSRTSEKIWGQAFIQVVLLSFQMIYFKTNNHKIIVKCRSGSGGAPSKFRGQIYSLKQKKPSKLIYFKWRSDIKILWVWSNSVWFGNMS